MEIKDSAVQEGQVQSGSLGNAEPETPKGNSDLAEVWQNGI